MIVIMLAPASLSCHLVEHLFQCSGFQSQIVRAPENCIEVSTDLLDPAWMIPTQMLQSIVHISPFVKR